MNIEKKIDLACDMATQIIIAIYAMDEHTLLTIDGSWKSDVQVMFDLWYDRISELLDGVQ